MLKKSISIILFVIAQAVIMGHTLVPHRHVDERTHQHQHSAVHTHGADQHHHQDDHKDDDSGEPDPLQLAFANFAHGADVHHYLTNHLLHIDISKQVVKDVISDPVNDFYFSIPSLVLMQELPPGNLRLYRAERLHSLSLRGPPAFIV